MREITMPSLGADAAPGTLLEWRVKPGDTLKKGDIVAVVESDKGAIEVEAFEEGVVEALVAEVGATIPAGGVLARLARGTPAPPPPASPGVRASPGARARARELGVDLAAVKGSGPGGAVTREDVEAFARSGPAPAAAPAPGHDAHAAMRRAIAAAMARSKREIPHYYLSTRVDVDAALAWLTARNAGRSAQERVLPAALFVRAVAGAAREHPSMNGHWVDGAFRPSERVHLGFAVALRGGGLVAPAIHDADRLDLEAAMAALADLIQRVRQGTLRSSELTDPTLTLTSLGDLGVETVHGVINPPQVAIVGMGRVAQEPWVVEGRVVPRQVLTLALAADHRVSDGQAGARFLAAIAGRLTEVPA